jgi:transposase
MLGLVTHTADIQDRDGVPGVPGVILQAMESHPTLIHLFADGGYSGETLRDAMSKVNGPTIEIVKRPPGGTGFVVIARRWVVERTFAWLGRCRRLAKDRLAKDRLAKDWERSIASADAWALVASIRRSARHIARKTGQEF